LGEFVEKKKCDACKKIWLVEKFDQHQCIPVGRKPRKPTVKQTKPEKMKLDGVVKGSPLIFFNRISS
jgi:hypothetical protein